MKKLSILLVLLLPSLALGQWQEARMGPAFMGGVVSTSPCASYLICQGFEGTGYDNSETWTENVLSGGTINEDCASGTSNCPLVGDQSLYMDDNNSANKHTTYASFTPQDNTYIYFQVNIDSFGSVPGDTRSILELKDDAANEIVNLTLGATTSVWRLYDGTARASTTTPTEDTTYHVWLEYEKGTGANGKIRLYVSDTATKPAVLIDVTNSAKTAQAGRIYFVVNKDQTHIIDKVRVSSTAIGDNPS